MPKTICTKCGKTLNCDAYSWKDYQEVKVAASIGVQCQHCGSVYCNDHHKDLNFSFISGIEKVLCPNCGQSIGPGRVLVSQCVNLESQKECIPLPLIETSATLITEGEPATVAAYTAIEELCPTCGAPYTMGTLYCPGCGYDFATQCKGAGPAIFQTQKVESAYRPSGRTTTMGITAMILFAIVAGGLGGGVLHLGSELISGLGGSLFDGVRIKGIFALALIVAVFVVLFLISGVVGYAIGQIVSRGSILGKSRNPNLAATFAAGGGLLAFIVFFVLRGRSLGGEAVDSPIDFIKMATILVGLLVGAIYIARENILGAAFCEECGKFMKEKSLNPIAAHIEGTLIEQLQAQRYQDVAKLAVVPIKDKDNSVTITVLYCNTCQIRGFVNAEKVQTRTRHVNVKKSMYSDKSEVGDSTTKVVKKCLIYSAAVSSGDLKGLGIIP